MEETQLDDPSAKLILLVDDDEGLLDLTERILAKEGFRTERAMDGQEGLAKARTLEPDLLLLDFMLPKSGGYEVLRELQASGHGRIPIVLITGRPLDAATLDMVRAEPNVRDFLQKPVRQAILATMLHSILRTRPPEINRADHRSPLSGGIF